MAYRGKYKPLNESKYHGDPRNITYRSLWERSTMKWLDQNPQISSWSSETTIIPYRCKTDNKIHRYFMDITFITTSGEKWMIEIKPKKQTLPPNKPKRVTKRYKEEVMTYVKNTSKWEAAKKYAHERGFKFAVWTEDELTQLGIKILKK